MWVRAGLEAGPSSGILLRDDRDLCGIGSGCDGVNIEEEGSAGFDGEAGSSGCAHGRNGLDADYRDVKAHVLVGFSYFDDGKGAAEGGFGGRVKKQVPPLPLRLALLAQGPVGMTSFFGGSGVDCAKEGSGAGYGGVGAFHGFDRDAGLGGDDDGLAEVEGGDAAGHGAAVGDVLLFFGIGGAGGEDAGSGEERIEVFRRRDKFNPFIPEDSRYGSEEHVGIAGAEVEEEFGQAPVRADGGEDLFVLDLAGHGGAGDTFRFEDVDEPGELTEREPMEMDLRILRCTLLNPGIRLLADGGDDEGEPVRAGGVEEEEWKLSVAGDEAEYRHALTLAQRGGSLGWSAKVKGWKCGWTDQLPVENPGVLDLW